MMFRGLVVTLACVFVCVHGASNKTDGEALRSNGPNVLVGDFDFCPALSAYEDLREIKYKTFDEHKTAQRYNSPLPDQSQIQCQNSKFCSISQAQIRNVTCYNERVGWIDITWKCDANFYGSKFELANSTINCEPVLKGSTCVLIDSCIFYYTPRQSINMILVGFGGFIVLGIAIFGICVYVRRRNPLAASGTIISTSPNANVSSQACTALHPYPTAPQRYSNAPGYPGKQDYPPPFAAPDPQYAPQYSPPEPSKQAHY